MNSFITVSPIKRYVDSQINYLHTKYDVAHKLLPKKGNIYYPCYLFNYLNVKQVIFWLLLNFKHTKRVLDP